MPEEELLRARTRTNIKLNPHMTLSPGIEPGPHWWEASALTTAPSLLPEVAYYTFQLSTRVQCKLNDFVQKHQTHPHDREKINNLELSTISFKMTPCILTVKKREKQIENRSVKHY